MKRTYLVAYDIGNARRLRRVAKCCLNVGTRLQKSLYLCTLTEASLEWTWRELRMLIDETEDSLTVMPLCKSCLSNMREIGMQSDLQGEPYLYVV